MPSRPKILAFAGSARRDSFNKRLVRVAAAGVEAGGLACTLVDLRDFDMPVYDGDLEAEHGLPEAAVRFRALVAEHQAFLIASPEHNGSISPLLKNTIDWSTRSPQAQPDLSGWSGKTAALLAASPGPLGGMRGLAVVRTLLTNLGVTVLASQFTLRGAAKAFDDRGALVEAGQRDGATAVGRRLAEHVARLHAD